MVRQKRQKRANYYSHVLHGLDYVRRDRRYGVEWEDIPKPFDGFVNASPNLVVLRKCTILFIGFVNQ
jgi:hypothetical protein